MCIIVDTNKLAEFFKIPAREDAAPVRRWLHDRGALVFGVGGRFGEIGGRIQRQLRDLVQAGRARPVPAAELDQDMRDLEAAGQLRSNDPHILALARVSGARLLYTADQDLIDDFKNPDVVRPRGKVYKGVANARLLAGASCRCGGQSA